MFCIKCGNTLSENDKFCEVCGAKVEMPSQEGQETVIAPVVTETSGLEFQNSVTEAPSSEVLQDFQSAQNDDVNVTTDLEQQSVSDNASVVEQPNFIDSTQNGVVIDNTQVVQPEVKPKKRMSKKKKIFLSTIAGTLAAAIAAVSIFAWDYIENFFVETFSSDEGYYQYVEGKNVDELASSIGSVVALLNGDSSNLASNSTAKLQIGDTLLDYLAQRIGVDKTNIQWLSNVGVNTDISFVEGALSGGYDLLLGDKTAFSYDFIFDFDSLRLYACSPQLNEKYMVLDLAEMANLSRADIETGFAMLETLSDAMPDEATVTNIIARYLNTAIEAIDDVDKDSVTIKANGVSQSCTGLTYTIDEDAVKDILIAVLKEFKNDDEIKQILKDFVFATNAVDESQFDMMYDQVRSSIDMIIDEVDNIRMGDFEVEVTTYVDGRGEVIGREIVADDLGIDFHYYTSHNGDDVGVEMIFNMRGETIELLGSGTLDGDLLDCDYTLSVGGVKILKVKAVDYDVMKYEDGFINGTFIITLPEETCSLIEKNVGLSSEICEILPDLSLEITIKQSDSKNSFAVSVKYQSDMLVKLSLSNKTTVPSDIVIPFDAIEINDEDDLMDYMQSLDAEAFQNHLKDIGIPDSFFDLIQEAFEGSVKEEANNGGFIYDSYESSDSYYDGYYY